MTNLEDLKRHFKILYPNCTDKLDKKFQQFLEEHESSLSEVLETDFLAFVTKIMRVDLPQSMSFSDSLEKLLENKELREKMGKKAREFVSKNFSWDKSANALLEIYRNVTTKK